MKKLFTLLSVIAFSQANAQSVLLRDFETTSGVYFKDYDGTLDTLFANPDMSGVNTSSVCARYIRKNVQYDNLKAYATNVFMDISSWAQASTTNKLKLKVKSKMAVGSKIDIQLGSRTDQTYPGGIHSIYTGTTTVKGAWEDITFNLTSVPQGGFMLPASIDKLVILFNTNTLSTDTIYFDDLMGPGNAPVALADNKNSTYGVSGSKPNPAKDHAVLTVDVPSSSQVSVVVYDLLGKPVLTPLNETLSAGSHDIELNTATFPNGVYFYTVRIGDYTKTNRMVVSK